MKKAIFRLLAYDIDFILCSTVLVLPQLFVYQLTGGFPFTSFNQAHELYLWVLFTISLPVWVYFIYMESARQATFGKRLLGLKVTNADGNRIAFEQAILRTAIRLLPWEVTHFSLMWIYFEDEPNINVGIWAANGLIVLYLVVLFANRGKMALQDFLVGTRVKRS